jgi:hypothetical protein
VLARVDRPDGSKLVLEKRAYRGSEFLAVVNVTADAARFVTVRMAEVRRVALAMLRAAPPDDPAPPRGARERRPSGRPQAPPPWGEGRQEQEESADD